MLRTTCESMTAFHLHPSASEPGYFYQKDWQGIILWDYSTFSSLPTHSRQNMFHFRRLEFQFESFVLSRSILSACRGGGQMTAHIYAHTYYAAPHCYREYWVPIYSTPSSQTWHGPPIISPCTAIRNEKSNPRALLPMVCGLFTERHLFPNRKASSYAGMFTYDRMPILSTRSRQ